MASRQLVIRKDRDGGGVVSVGMGVPLWPAIILGSWGGNDYGYLRRDRSEI
ncbi:hypothetical protein D3C76_546010 [compost metagenome]